MNQLPVAELLASFQQLATLGQMATTLSDRKVGIDVPHRDWAEQVDSARRFVSSCAEMGLSTTAGVAAELVAELNNVAVVGNGMAGIEFGVLLRIANIISAFSKCLPHEARTKSAFSLSQEMMLLFEPPEPLWGSDVRSKFPSGLFEIDEAAKCLALGRSTACVFHLMRMLEISLRAVAKCLVLPQSGPNWGDMLRAMKKEQDQRGPRWPERELFNDLYARLDAIRDAWRNKTMHVENVYTHQQATELWAHTRSFVQKLATRMDEDGLPFA